MTAFLIQSPITQCGFQQTKRVETQTLNTEVIKMPYVIHLHL